MNHLSVEGLQHVLAEAITDPEGVIARLPRRLRPSVAPSSMLLPERQIYAAVAALRALGNGTTVADRDTQEAP